MESYEINDLVRYADNCRNEGDNAFFSEDYKSAKESYSHALDIADKIINRTGLDYCNSEYLIRRIVECEKKMNELVY